MTNYRSVKTVQSWRETPVTAIKKGDLVFLPDVNEWHPVGAVDFLNGQSKVWFGLSSHYIVLCRETYKVAIKASIKPVYPTRAQIEYDRIIEMIDDRQDSLDLQYVMEAVQVIVEDFDQTGHNRIKYISQVLTHFNSMTNTSRQESDPNDEGYRYDG